MLKSYPTIFQIGHRLISDILEDEVEITEKIDGSFFEFGVIDNILYCRSKNAHIHIEEPVKMFEIGVNYAKSKQNLLLPNKLYFLEFLNKPKHNVIAYNRVPKNNLALFGVSDPLCSQFFEYNALKYEAERLDIEVVPLLYNGKISGLKEIEALLETDSILGGSKIEGVVIKNHNKVCKINNIVEGIMIAKYVSEKFREKHRKNWRKEHTSGGKFQVFKDSFKTEARWQKAVQHLKEQELIDNEPKDIGKLIKEIQRDIIKEETDTIKDFLFKEFSGDILRNSTKGFADWYKKQLGIGEINKE